ncbi:galactokinase [Erysipelothrix urinaevulpis]|uniref:galactokinase n=1 Tax=Erysipelothrix urinaevulpis TaxID=2683717 RepID=UPI0019164C83|nr:galactokinase [Erysipelothrix urinaevulpis]
MIKNELEKKFETVFQKKAEATYFAPGRINLIGEHIDYHGGKVLPAAISIGTYGVVKKREDNLIQFYSANFEGEGIYQFTLPVGEYDKKDSWTNYTKGIIKILDDAGYSLSHGFDLLVYGNIPYGSGLSSSASLEVLMAWILKELYNFDYSRVDTAIYTKQSENDYVGVNCGIMDQFAVAMGKVNQAMLLDTNDLSYEYVPIELTDSSILIMNSNRKRGLEDSLYNQRRTESEQAFELINSTLKKEYLSDFTLDELYENKEMISDELLYRRAHHVVSENVRTMEAVQALKNNDLIEFGNLLNQSHASLKNDYEVSSLELDLLVETVQNLEGVYGARMTGAGFGGCAIALVENSQLEKVSEIVKRVYKENTEYEADTYVAEIYNGVQKI